MLDSDIVKDLNGLFNESNDYMCHEHKIYFKNKLLKWRKELLIGDSSLKEYLTNEIEATNDINDLASIEELLSLKIRYQNRNIKILSKIQRALLAIETNSYGYCKNCDQVIGLHRLDARLTAELCIDCKTFAEYMEMLRR